MFCVPSRHGILPFCLNLYIQHTRQRNVLRFCTLEIAPDHAFGCGHVISVGAKIQINMAAESSGEKNLDTAGLGSESVKVICLGDSAVGKSK